MRGFVLIALVASACSFQSGALPSVTDAGIDGPPPISVGFAKDTTQTDEEAGVVPIRVILSQAASEAITVAFAVSGGTASRPDDFLLDDGTLTFAPGDIEETIDITIGPDGMDEPNETIELTLSNPSGAGLGIAMHTVTIDMSVLPRVTFSTPMSDEAESVATPATTIVLDKASSLTTSVEVMVTGGSATTGVDFVISSTTITFNPGEVSKPIPLAVTNDLLDEPDEDVALALVNPTNIVVGTAAATTHTINDNDPAPTVQFDDVTSRVSEAGPFVDIAVSLSAESGKNVNVPFSVTAGTASNTDYTIATASPLAFTAGTTTLNIRVNITQDMLVEGNETVVLTLGTPTPMPNAALGANTTHTLTIRDDDQTCLGAIGTAWELCFETPSDDVALVGTINTDTSPLCSATPPLSGWTGQPDACFIVGVNIGAALAVTFDGTRPVVLFATGDVGIVGNLDLAGHRADRSAGPGAGIGCAAYTDAPLDSTSGAGGGAGGSFRTAGGNGGQGNGAMDSGGTALPATSGAPATLRGGCNGQTGGNGFGNPGLGSTGGVGGGGGGAIYIVAGGTIAVTSGSTINVSGGGADAVTTPDNGFFGGGGGGGSGGMIAMFATAYSVSGARFMANGGGGSAGADDNTAGVDGGDPVTSVPGDGGNGGSSGSAGAAGGRGFGIDTSVANGSNGGSNDGGGGGGGGGGYISSNLALTGATVSAGDIDP